MSDEALERDAVLGRALSEIDSGRLDDAGWTRLRQGIGARAATELARRRTRLHQRLLVIGASLAAGLALFVATSGTMRTPQDAATAIERSRSVAERVSTDQLLDAEVSDGDVVVVVAPGMSLTDVVVSVVGSVTTGTGRRRIWLTSGL